MPNFHDLSALLGGFGVTPDSYAASFGQSGGGGAGGRGEGGAEGAGGTVQEPTDMIPVELALQQITESYRNIIKLGVVIDRTYGMAGLGRRVPCDIVNHYNNAVRAYIKGAGATLRQIQAVDPEFTVMQTGYDQHGGVVAQKRGVVPLMPPTIDQPECGRPPMMTESGQLGGAPIIYWIAMVVMSAVTGFAVTAYIMKDTPESTKEQVDAHIARAMALIECGRKRRVELEEAGQKVITQTEIDAFCRGELPKPPDPKPPANGTDWWVWALVGAGVVVGGLVLAKYLMGRNALAGYDDDEPDQLGGCAC